MHLGREGGSTLHCWPCQRDAVKKANTKHQKEPCSFSNPAISGLSHFFKTHRIFLWGGSCSSHRGFPRWQSDLVIPGDPTVLPGFGMARTGRRCSPMANQIGEK